MAKNVIMPALGMAQETGLLISWLKQEGDAVIKGEPLMEIETDKATVEIEAPESGILGGITAQAGDVIPVGQTIAWILAAGEEPPAQVSMDTQTRPQTPPRSAVIEASPLARKIAEEHSVDLALIKANGKRIEKADVLAYLKEEGGRMKAETLPIHPFDVAQDNPSSFINHPSRTPASPKARRLAVERGIDIATLKGSGPDGAVLAADVPLEVALAPSANIETLGSVWRIMAERMTNSWTTVPHFYLMREVDASNLIEWRSRVASTVEQKSGIKPTYTDLLVKLIGFTLREHPRLNAAWTNGNIQFNQEVNVGIAVAVEEGLIVPVIRNADSASISEIAAQRKALVERAQSRKVRPADISDGTFTLSNLGMYNVDAFSAIVNPPQAAILAVGRIAERVVPLNGQVVIRPMMVMTLSCDHRVVDGARGAQFLDDLANLLQDPWRLLA
jgi:pyruvate dehydrogenase E2 component (dihydrolipoamide acetyltransferase)